MRPVQPTRDEARARYQTRLSVKPEGLTTRELDVLTLIAEGRTNKEIAAALFISEHTVTVHVARILQKTGASNRTEAVVHATRRHLLGPAAASPGVVFRRLISGFFRYDYDRVRRS